MRPATCVRVSAATKTYRGDTVAFDQNPNVQEHAPPATIPCAAGGFTRSVQPTAQGKGARVAGGATCGQVWGVSICV